MKARYTITMLYSFSIMEGNWCNSFIPQRLNTLCIYFLSLHFYYFFIHVLPCILLPMFQFQLIPFSLTHHMSIRIGYHIKEKRVHIVLTTYLKIIRLKRHQSNCVHNSRRNHKREPLTLWRGPNSLEYMKTSDIEGITRPNHMKPIPVIKSLSLQMKQPSPNTI